MNTTPPVPPHEFAEAMKEEMERYLQEVMQTVNNAPDGQWIAASEEKVRDLSADLRRRVV